MGAECLKEAINSLLSEMAHELMKEIRKAAIKKILELLSPPGFTWRTRLIVSVGLCSGALALLFITDGSGPSWDLFCSLGVAMIQIAIVVIMG